MPNSPALILIIEGAPSELRLLSSFVKDQGDIIFAISAREGVKLARLRSPDLILLGGEFADDDRESIARELKAHCDTRDIPLLFLVNHDGGEETLALELGADDIISKPFNPALISKRVQTQLMVKRQNRQLESFTQQDKLTGAYCRAFFDKALRNEWRRHQRQRQFLALVLVDCDQFSQINESLGFAVGDKCLRELALVLKQNTRRPGEIAARFSKDQFICLLPNTSVQEAYNFGNRLCRLVRDKPWPSLVSADRRPALTISAGCCASIPDGDFEVEDFLQQSLNALSRAKQAGGDRCDDGAEVL